MNQLLLDGAPVAGVRWDTGSATFTLPKTKPGGGAWGANDAVRLQLIVDGVASKEVILVVGPPPSLDDGQSPSGPRART
jgi:hypothetical protein